MQKKEKKKKKKKKRKKMATTVAQCPLYGLASGTSLEV